MFLVTIVALMFGGSSAGVTAAPSACEPIPATVPVAAGGSEGWTSEQMGNARTIAGTGAKLNVPARGQQIGIATAIQESGLRNLDYGDRDSLGLFQQRPSQGWGSPAQITDPVYASSKFFTGLLGVSGWQNMPLAEVAQAVQRSAFPDAYAKWEDDALSIMQSLGADIRALPVGCNPAGLGGTIGCPPTGLGAEIGLTAEALQVLRCIQQNFGKHVYGGVGDRPANPNSDHPSGRAVDIMINQWQTVAGNAKGWAVAEWAAANAESLGIAYVIFDVKIWQVGDPITEWLTYGHPSGATDANNLHRNHVHISVQDTARSA